MPDDRIIAQTFPFPTELDDAVKELRYVPGWKFTLDHEDRGQGCTGLTLSIYPDKPDAYNLTSHVRTRFLYPVPAAAFNRESWEEWLWARIAETEDHERAEWFRFAPLERDEDGETETERRPFKPAHADGWDPGVVRSVVSESVVNTPNAGRLVKVPCSQCPHHHESGMGEHFTAEWVNPCPVIGCVCEWRVSHA